MENNARLNDIYNNILMQVKKEHGKGNGFAPTVQPWGSFIQVDYQLASNNPRYSFPLTKNTASRTSERRLDINDAFAITHIGLFLKREDSAKPGKGVLQTYPNNTVFALEALNLDPDDLEAIYNGTLSIKVGEKTWVDAMSTTVFRSIRTTQQASASTKSEQVTLDGFVEAEPYITLDGSEQNEIVLNIPSYAGMLLQNSTGGAGQTVYVVLKCYGFLIKGGSGLSKVNK